MQWLNYVATIGGALISVGHVIKLFAPPNTVAWKVADAIMNGIGSWLSQPASPPPAGSAPSSPAQGFYVSPLQK